MPRASPSECRALSRLHFETPCRCIGYPGDTTRDDDHPQIQLRRCATTILMATLSGLLVVIGCLIGGIEHGGPVPGHRR